MTPTKPTAIDLNRQYLYNIALGLSLFTIFYNLLEGMVAVWFGVADETLALFGFGLDSFIEMISGVGIAHLVWRTKQYGETQRGNFERTALRITGYAFYALIVVLSLSVVIYVYIQHKPLNTFWGVVVSCISIAVMWALLYGKLYVGTRLESDSIIADANCTRACIYMSVILLISSGIYYLTNFAYADTIGTFGIIYFCWQEGKECFDKAAGKATCCGHC